MRFLLLIVFIGISFFAFAQQKKLDSLITVNKNYPKEDSLKVILLTNIFRQYSRHNDFKKLEEYADQALIIAKKLPQYFSQAYVYERLGLCYHGKAMYKQAIDAYTKGIDVALKGNLKKRAANFYLNLGAVYTSINDYTHSLENSQLAVNIYNELNDQESLSACYLNIGVIYKNLNEPQKAIQYIQKALVIFEKDNAGVSYGVALAHEVIGTIYKDISDSDLKKMGITLAERFTLAMNSLQKAAAIAKMVEDENLIYTITMAIGNLYENEGNKKLALLYYEKALIAIKKDNNNDDLAFINLTLGKFYYLNNEFGKSITLLKKSIEVATKFGLLEVQQKSFESLSYAYEKTGKYDSALIFYKQNIALKDSIYSNEKEKEITRKKLQLDFSIKENSYKLIQQVTDGKLRQQSLLATQQQQQLQLKQQQLALINKEKDLQRLAYLKTQVELQNEQQVQSSLLQKNSLEAKYNNQVNGAQIAKQKLQIADDKKVKFFLALAVVFVFMIAGLIFYSLRKTAVLNQIINNQKNTLEQLGNVKDKIFTVVSHDMRAPVNSLISFIDILEEGKIPQDKLNLYAKELKQNLTHTSALMNNLLNWAASQMQGFKPVKESFDLAILINETIITLQHHINQKQVFVINDIVINTILNEDRNMMATILRNLISNAIKYSYKEGTILVSFKNSLSLNQVIIGDEGTGMQPDEIEKFNNNNSNQPVESKRGTLNEKGTGLGLLLCKTFAAQMGGKIEAIKNEKGMFFILTLST